MKIRLIRGASLKELTQYSQGEEIAPAVVPYRQFEPYAPQGRILDA